MTDTYTYRAGKKLTLKKKSDQFVIRALPNQIDDLGVTNAQQMSTQSTRLTLPASELEHKMQMARTIAPTHHAYVTEENADFLITDRIYVKFTAQATPQDIDDLAGKYGLLLVEKLTDLEYIYQLTDSTGMNPIKLVVLLTEDQDNIVEIAENDLNYTVTLSQFVTPTESAYDRQWHLHTRSDSMVFDPRASSRSEDAWKQLGGFGSPNVVIGVTDDGCNLSHHDFDSPNKFAGWGYFEGSNLLTTESFGVDPDKMYQTGANHGTACAGVIAGEVDGEVTVGAAPGCRLLPIKWPSSGQSLFIGDLRLRKVLDYVGDKIDVLSNSWGNPLNGNVGFMVGTRIENLAQNGGRRGKGIVFLWAAGNENCPIHHVTGIDTPYTSGVEFTPSGAFWVGVETSRQFQHNLASVPGVMYVGAINSQAKRSHYSNYGTGLAICAPSNNVHTYHRLTVNGLGITTVLGTTDTGVRNNFGGTSSATPLVAGIAGLVISANPSLTAIEVISILKQTASKDLDITGYARTPPAAFDLDPVWDVSPIAPFHNGQFTDVGSDDGTWSPWFGHGKVDAEAAVKRAKPSVAESRVLVRDKTVQRTIPDNNLAGLSSVIEFPETGVIESLSVKVDITHTYISDLRVLLESPDGSVIKLHDQTGRFFDDIKKTYTLANAPQLLRLIDTMIQGLWKLHVVDSVGLDTGTLNSWGVSTKVRSL